MMTAKKYPILPGHVDTLFRLYEFEQKHQSELSQTLYKQGSEQGLKLATRPASDLGTKGFEGKRYLLVTHHS